MHSSVRVTINFVTSPTTQSPDISIRSTSDPVPAVSVIITAKEADLFTALKVVSEDKLPKAIAEVAL